jgi:hypothetical protein
MKTVNYSFASNFVDFALSSITSPAKKLGGWLVARACFWKKSDLDRAVELDTLRSLQSENRGNDSAIDRTSWATGFVLIKLFAHAVFKIGGDAYLNVRRLKCIQWDL